ncbi:hypothetical protein E2C01_073710 [Portunus trituberculatus]|uniref:Uncharacterized protein n=1 Tax=Portunus trituberculatus TaxID=210409 RepID=A0A5B7IBC3_PORTR|nr:hypothetical protein [Portunus trituberculatus]
MLISAVWLPCLAWVSALAFFVLLTLDPVVGDHCLLGAGQVVQLHWGPPLEVLGAAVAVRFYLLITSLQPLRVHLHSHAEVTFRLPAHRGYSKAYLWEALFCLPDPTLKVK